MNKQVVTCQICLRQTLMPFAFRVAMKYQYIAENHDYSHVPEAEWLCRWHGMQQFKLGRDSHWYFSEYYKVKARKYLLRYGENRLAEELKRISPS